MQTYEERISVQQARFSMWRASIARKKFDVTGLEANLALQSQAIEVLTAVLSITQGRVAEFIENMVSEALRYVYGDAYGFRVIFELKRNQPEICLHPTKNGHLYNPKFSGGVGVLDVCAFVLRYVCWALAGDNTEPVMLHDEPFRNVHGSDENARLSAMVKRMSELLGLQIIIVSGESLLAAEADATFEVGIKEGVSFITRVH